MRRFHRRTRTFAFGIKIALYIWESLRRSSEERIMKIEDILVPIDFSAGSLRALDYALAMVDAGGEIYLLHVIDAEFLARVSDEGFSDVETARARMQRKAEGRLREIAQERSGSAVRVESMVVVGKPFAEILRIAADLDFSLIVMGIRGRHQGGIEEILFGSTAEKVLRGARIPVVCVPPGIERGIVAGAGNGKEAGIEAEIIGEEKP